MGSSVLFWLAFKVLISWELVSRGVRKSSFRGGCFLSAAILGKEQPSRMHRTMAQETWACGNQREVGSKGLCRNKECNAPETFPMDKDTVPEQPCHT